MTVLVWQQDIFFFKNEVLLYCHQSYRYTKFKLGRTSGSGLKFRHQIYPGKETK